MILFSVSTSNAAIIDCNASNPAATTATTYNIPLVETGTTGPDVIRGCANVPNTLNGGDGDDNMGGGNLADTLNGGDGDDTIAGHNGNDTIDGGNGDDRLFGELGNDIIHGGPGDDRIASGSNDDQVFGDDGADVLRLGPGKDSGDGGAGDDEFWTRDGEADTVNCGAGDDAVHADSEDDVSDNCERVRRG